MSSKMAFWQTPEGMIWGIDPDGQTQNAQDCHYQVPLSMDQFKEVVRGFLFCQQMIALELMGLMLEPERLYFHGLTRDCGTRPWEEVGAILNGEDRPVVAIDPGCGYGVIRYRDVALTPRLGDFITICRTVLGVWQAIRAQGEPLDPGSVLAAAEQIILKGDQPEAEPETEGEA